MDNTQIGRPPVYVAREDVQALRALNLSWTKIARVLGVSRQTLYRRLKEYNIPCSDWSAISTVDLDHLLQEIKDNHPNAGEVMMNGYLVALGIRVPRSQLRESIHRVDHHGTELRQLHTVKRRQYSVESPNAVWHIDGHHKLIRWRFVVHAAIDGFSRVIPYIKCADNNRASTVLEVFCNGVTRFGLPERVRSDHGGENIHVWRYMLDTHNGDHQCVITGCSTHNERVERLWRDVHRSLSHFQDTFRDLESGVLDLLNEVDMFSLHYIFLPMINKCLQDFQESWNNHTLSSEGNMTPYQLFAEGMNYAAELNMPAVMSVQAISQQPIQPDEQEEIVHVPKTLFSPCQTIFHHLQQSVNPLQHSSDQGKQLYRQTVTIVGQHLLSGCYTCTIN